jgi:hypothetical protein
VRWLAAGLEGLDDEHPAAAAGARAGERLRWTGLAGLLGRGWGQVQEFTHGFDRFGAIGAGEQGVVADAVETLRRTRLRKRRMNSPTSSVMVM